MQVQAACTLNRNLVVVDLDDVKDRHILGHAFDAVARASRFSGACPWHP